jgi:hypothetical protein
MNWCETIWHACTDPSQLLNVPGDWEGFQHDYRVDRAARGQVADCFAFRIGQAAATVVAVAIAATTLESGPNRAHASFTHQSHLLTLHAVDMGASRPADVTPLQKRRWWCTSGRQ